MKVINQGYSFFSPFFQSLFAYYFFINIYTSTVFLGLDFVRIILESCRFYTLDDLHGDSFKGRCKTINCRHLGPIFIPVGKWEQLLRTLFAASVWFERAAK